MNLRNLLTGIDIIETTANLELEITGVSYDSRNTKSGDLFVAVSGYESDGHAYIDTAARKGAICVLCEKKPESAVPYILIQNTRKGLASVSANWFDHPASSLKIIGITGTNGKTTTTSLVKTVIESCTGAMVGLIGTNQNMIGDAVYHTDRTTPESFEIQQLFRQMADKGCSYVVMEVSSHALFLDRVYGITFEMGVFTNLTQDHLDFHETMENYGAAKAILFSRSKLGIINLDDPYAQMMMDAATCPVFTYSALKDEANLVAKSIKLNADHIEFIALTIGKLQRIELMIPGMFSVYNALAAISVGLNLEYELLDIAEALRQSKGVMGRAEVVPTGQKFTILIDYACTPDALENIINTVRNVAPGRVVTLFGCGGDRDKTKRPIMGEIAVRLSDFVIVTSDNPRTEVPAEIINDILEGMKSTKTPYQVIENRREAIGWSIDNAQPDDVIILAGKGHETYQIIGKEKIHFDEREVVADFLSALTVE